MVKKQADEVKGSAEETTEAIEKIAKKLKKTWKWKPEPGQWGLTDYGEAVLIFPNWDEKSKKNCPLMAITDAYGITSCIGPDYHEVGIPILEWEEIARILGEWGLRISFNTVYTSWKDFDYECEIRGIYRTGYQFLTSGPRRKSRQEATMEAIKGLIKEVKFNGLYSLLAKGTDNSDGGF